MSESPSFVQGLVMCRGRHGERVSVAPAHVAAAYLVSDGDSAVVRVVLAGGAHVDLHRSEKQRFGFG